MSKRVIGDVSECLMCGSYGPLERHHIFGGANRKNSESDGLCVMLCHTCHNEPPLGAHYSLIVSNYLKREGQRYAEKELGMTRVEFIARYGKNYLGSDYSDVSE